MPISRVEEKRVETYVKELFAAAKLENREVEDLESLQAAMRLPREIIDLLVVMSEEVDLRRLPDVADAYQKMLVEVGGTVAVDVTTAVPLDDDLRTKIKEKVQADLGKPVYLVERVDPTIMGGIIINAGGQRRDVSVRTQLQNVRMALTKTAQKGSDDSDAQTTEEHGGDSNE